MSLWLVATDSINRLPFYAQVENVIIGFSNRSLPHGARLPSEDNLVQEYAFSRTSLRPAIQSSVQQGSTPLAQKRGLTPRSPGTIRRRRNTPILQYSNTPTARLQQPDR